MTPCISQATTLGLAFEDDFPAYAQAGWPAAEVWLTKLETFLDSHPISEARGRIADSGLVVPAASGQGGLLLAAGREREVHQDLFSRRLELLAALAIPTLVVAADTGPEPTPDDYARGAEALAGAAEKAAPFGVRLALEFPKTSRFCSSLATALALIEGSGCGPDRPGVCLDFFHFEAGPSKLADLAYLAPGDVAWVQASDLAAMPRELAGDADRVLPGDGDIAIGAILDGLSAAGYTGHVSLEVLNPQLWRAPGAYVADAGLRALSRSLGDRSAARTGGP